MDDVYFLREACRWAAECSHDPVTQNGAVIVAKSGRFVGAGNRMPVGLKHYPGRLERPEKYRWIEHAERAAIYEAALEGLPTLKARMYCPWFACRDCARAIIMAGIKEVVGHIGVMTATPDRWRGEITAAEIMLREAGIGIRLLTADLGVKIRFDGKELTL